MYDVYNNDVTIIIANVVIMTLCDYTIHDFIIPLLCISSHVLLHIYYIGIEHSVWVVRSRGTWLYFTLSQD